MSRKNNDSPTAPPLSAGNGSSHESYYDVRESMSERPSTVSVHGGDLSDNANDGGGVGVGQETTPLLFHTMRSGNISNNNNDAAAENMNSVRSTGSTDDGGNYIGFSSHWLNTAKLDRKETFRSERELAVKKGIVQAAFLIRDAVLGESENPSKGTYDPYFNPDDRLRNLLSLIFRQILSYRLLRQLLYATVWIVALLTFVEPPRWCRYGYGGDATKTCQVLFDMEGPPAAAGGEAASVNNDVEYYPSARSLLLTSTEAVTIEWIGLSFVTLIILFRIGRDGCSILRYLRRGPAQAIRLLQLFSLVVLFSGLLSGYMICQPFARLVLLGTFLPSLHQEVVTTLTVLPEVLNICVMLVVYMVFWAFLGTVLFYETDQGTQGFSTLVESLWTLWICITTANYPDVMMPSYNQNRFAALYFVLFMIITFFFFMNLILASVVNTYDDVMSDRKKYRKEEENSKLSEAFRIMDPDNTGTIDRDTVMTLFKILNKDFPEFRHISSRDAKLLYAVLDRDGSSLIQEHEFLDFGSILLLEFFNEDEFATFVQNRFPKLYKSAQYQSFLKFVKSSTFDLIIDIILVLNAVVVTIQSWPVLVGNPVTLDEHYLDGTIDTKWELIEAIFTVIYCLEATLKIIALGWRSYIERARNVFDLLITILAVLASVYVYYPNDFSDSRLIRYIVMTRVMRLVRIIVSMKRFQLVGVIWYEILPYATSVMCLLFFIMYAFAALGVELYGGLVTRDPSNPLSYLILNTDFSDNDYWANNFNDLISAFNVLFNLLVVNNWTECEIGFEAVTQKKWVRYYFFLFHFSGVILVNNLVIAFFINAFLQQRKILENRKDLLTVDGEAVIHGREATFDASTITGTRTSLTGGFIARIRTNAAEEDEQDRLRRLFTQTSDREEVSYKRDSEQHDYVMPFARS